MRTRDHTRSDKLRVSGELRPLKSRILGERRLDEPPGPGELGSDKIRIPSGYVDQGKVHLVAKDGRDRPRREPRVGWFRWIGKAGATRDSTQRGSAVLGYLDVDVETARRLGSGGLQDVWENLWPVDCQTCGSQIGAERPALYVADMVVFVSASVHHRACQAPEWSKQPRISGGRHLSWRAKTLLLFGTRRTGDCDDRPLMLVNPGLEQVVLGQTNEGRRVNTVPYYRKLSLGTPRRDFDVDQPVSDAYVRIHRANITVRLESCSEVWSCSADRDTQDRIHELGGIILGITTAADPDDIMRYGDLFSLIDSEKLLFGWVPLEGTEHHQPLRETEEPDALTIHLLHRSDRDAIIGEPLATTTAFPEQEAGSWAAGLLFTEPPDWPLEWQQVSRDPAARWVIDPLAAGFYSLQQHADGWKLIKVLSQITGSGFRTEQQARQWAERVVRARTKTGVFDWRPVPGTGTGFATLQGVAASTR